jgi:hypothetical protein
MGLARVGVTTWAVALTAFICTAPAAAACNGSAGVVGPGAPERIVGLGPKS